AVAAHVPDLDRGLRPERLLQVDAPLLDVRRSQVSRHPQNVARRAAAVWIAVGLDVEYRTGSAPVQRAAWLGCCRRDNAAVDVRSDGAGGNHVDSRRRGVVDSVLSEKHRQYRDLVSDARPCSDHRIALALRVPDDPDPRSEVVMIALIRRVDVDT